MSLFTRIMLMLIVCVVEMMTSFLFIPSESTASRCNNLLDVLVWCIWQGGLVCSFFFLSIRRQYCSTAVRMVVYLYSIVVFVLTGFSIAVCVLFSGILFFDADFRFIFFRHMLFGNYGSQHELYVRNNANWKDSKKWGYAKVAVVRSTVQPNTGWRGGGVWGKSSTGGRDRHL